MRFYAVPFFIVLLLFSTIGCGKYAIKKSGAKRGQETISVATIENNAALILPVLSANFTEALKSQYVRNTPLRLVETGGDLQFSGEITKYDIQPVSIQASDKADQNRLTIATRIAYKCLHYPKDSWTHTFTQFSDFNSSANLIDVEAELAADIVDRLAQDIFNKTHSNW